MRYMVQECADIGEGAEATQVVEEVCPAQFYAEDGIDGVRYSNDMEVDPSPEKAA